MTGRILHWKKSKPEIEGQLELFPNVAVVQPKDASIEERFLSFHYANPHIYRNLRTLALAMKKSGHDKVGIKLLIEKLRWEYAIHTKHAEGEYAINNDFTSRYARLLMQDPKLVGMFQTRELRDEREEREERMAS